MTGESSAKLWFGVRYNAKAFLEALCRRLATHGWRVKQEKKFEPTVGQKRGSSELDAGADEPAEKRRKHDVEARMPDWWHAKNAERDKMFAQQQHLQWALKEIKENAYNFSFVLGILVQEACPEDMATLEHFEFVKPSKGPLTIRLGDLGGNVESDPSPESEDEQDEQDEQDEKDQRDEQKTERDEFDVAFEDKWHRTYHEELRPKEYTVTATHYDLLRSLSTILNIELPRTMIGCLETEVM